ncbi:alpha-(1,3)-fucosyltransferase 4-like [Trichomycterus rosablanca]|uniref:alpha-(1,3)-fucosyltransferase 4-like n=1 Tax=Trichomycterus rosablanca TaxID=2290929 RepID=UPI002F350B0F
MVHGSDLRLFVLALVFTFTMLALSPLSLPVPEPDVSARTAGRTELRNVTLLVWWLPFGNGLQRTDCAASYGVPGCSVTADRREYERADAVIMHHRELAAKRSDLPTGVRPAAQKWIWMNFESPSHSGFLYEFDGMFNLTMSYRPGSDIFLPYGYLNRRRSAGQVRVNRKRGLVAWVISNWRPEQDRVQFYLRLRRFLPVDLYGRRFRPLLNDSVVRTVSAYKFYLAFENSIHLDYITEKLWHNALAAGAVPVVLGPPRENYERFLPADAFIHVQDFKGPRELAAYLKHLDRNPARYRRYLEWRRDYSVHVTTFWEEHYCTACQAVRACRHVNNTVTDLKFWFQS